MQTNQICCLVKISDKLDDVGEPGTDCVIEMRRCNGHEEDGVAEVSTCDVMVTKMTMDVDVQFSISAGSKLPSVVPLRTSQKLRNIYTPVILNQQFKNKTTFDVLTVYIAKINH